MWNLYQGFLALFITAVAGNDFNYSLFLDANRNYLFQWNINETHITIEVQVSTLGWVGLGLSPNGGMLNADIAIMWIKNGKLTLEDRFAKGNFEPIRDAKQDWMALYGYENKTHTIVGFSRLLDTCDSIEDRKITADTVHLIYAYHSKDPQYDQLMKHEERGSRSVFLTDPTPEFVIPNHTMNITVFAKQFKVPSDTHTVYWCSLYKLQPFKSVHHMIAAQPYIVPGNEKFVHHMILHLCKAGFNDMELLNDTVCYETEGIKMMTECNEVLVGWSVGGQGFVYPENIGHPFGVELNGRWIVLETHYDNSHYIKGIVDASGLILYLTDILRPLEAGAITLGTADFSWGVTIPPNQSKFTIMSHCDSSCFDDVIPDEGVFILNYMFHTHLLGSKIRARLIRNGTETIPLFKDDNYDFNYQEIRLVKDQIKIQKGDYFIVECEYNSEGRENVTIGGLSTHDEMCLVYIMFYPKKNLTNCLSITDPNQLAKTLGMDINVTDTYSSKKTVLKYLNSYDWKNETKIKTLQDFYLHNEQIQLCKYKVNETDPEVRPIPKYTPYIEPNSTCLNHPEDSASLIN